MPRICSQFARFALLLGVIVASLANARAGVRSEDVTCRQIEPGSLEIDGSLTDWPRSGPAVPATDGALALACAYDTEHMYLAVRVRDDRIVRRAKGAEDKLEVSVGDNLGNRGPEVVFSFRPATSTLESSLKKVDGKVLQAVDSLQPDGWSLEVVIDRELSGSGYQLFYQDVDGAHSRVENVGGFMRLAGAEATFQALLKATGLTPGQIKFDTRADVSPSPGAERVVAGGSMFAVIAQDFFFVKLPVAAPEDVLGVRVTPAFGKGKNAIVTHYRQHGNGGSRELVRVWRVTADGGFESTMTVEVGKKLGDQALLTRWSFETRKDGSGQDLLIEALPPVGFTETTFHESPATDVVPILLPWNAENKARHRFDQSGYAGPQLWKRSR